jgi:hypothetical protein
MEVTRTIVEPLPPPNQHRPPLPSLSWFKQWSPRPPPPPLPSTPLPTPSVVAVANVVSLQYRSTPAPPLARCLATSPIIGYHCPPSVPPPTAFHYRLQPLLIVEYVSCPFFHLLSCLHPPHLHQYTPQTSVAAHSQPVTFVCPLVQCLLVKRWWEDAQTKCTPITHGVGMTSMQWDAASSCHRQW